MKLVIKLYEMLMLRFEERQAERLRAHLDWTGHMKPQGHRRRQSQ